mmetsp:Transcript_79865/g.140946  ORF Transcript_79865/g.140946 Transcript_79865/m.140946 type:complete len:86 (-) Transcript_79865:950-1207(-)
MRFEEDHNFEMQRQDLACCSKRELAWRATIHRNHFAMLNTRIFAHLELFTTSTVKKIVLNSRITSAQKGPCSPLKSRAQRFQRGS